jgi:hypothetical protein
MFTYKNTSIRRPVKHLGTKWAHQPIYKNTSIHRAPLKVPLEHHHLPLPQAVVAHPLLVPPALEVVVRSSQHQLLLPVVPRPAMAVESPHTAPGCPHPGCATTCPQARPVTPPPGDGVCPQNLLRHPPEEHVMAQHQGHQTDVSSLLSLISWSHHDVLTPTSLSNTRPSPRRSLRLLTSRRSPQLHLAPARCHICTYKQATDSINIYIIYICHAISNKKHIYQHHQHTSMVKHLPWR